MSAPKVSFVESLPLRAKRARNAPAWKGFVIAQLAARPNQWALVDIPALQTAPYMVHLRKAGEELGFQVETALRGNDVYARVVDE